VARQHDLRRSTERAASEDLNALSQTDAQEFRLSREDDRGQASELTARASDGDSSTDFNLCATSANTRLRQLETSHASVFSKQLSHQHVLRTEQPQREKSILTGGPLHTLACDLRQQTRNRGEFGGWHAL
jgi:hypothetical protein